MARRSYRLEFFCDVESFEGSDAANFFTDLSFPILPFKGNENAIVIAGSDLGWSGSGVFHFFEETTMFNGTFVPGRYGGETPGKDFDGEILKGSRVEFDFVPEPGAVSLLLLGGAASDRFEGAARFESRRFSNSRWIGRSANASAARTDDKWRRRRINYHRATERSIHLSSSITKKKMPDGISAIRHFVDTSNY